VREQAQIVADFPIVDEFAVQFLNIYCRSLALEGFQDSLVLQVDLQVALPLLLD